MNIKGAGLMPAGVNIVTVPQSQDVYLALICEARNFSCTYILVA